MAATHQANSMEIPNHQSLNPNSSANRKQCFIPFYNENSLVFYPQKGPFDPREITLNLPKRLLKKFLHLHGKQAEEIDTVSLKSKRSQELPVSPTKSSQVPASPLKISLAKLAENHPTESLQKGPVSPLKRSPSPDNASETIRWKLKKTNIDGVYKDFTGSIVELQDRSTPAPRDLFAPPSKPRRKESKIYSDYFDVDTTVSDPQSDQASHVQQENKENSNSTRLVESSNLEKSDEMSLTSPKANHIQTHNRPDLLNPFLGQDEIRVFDHYFKLSFKVHNISRSKKNDFEVYCLPGKMQDAIDEWAKNQKDYYSTVKVPKNHDFSPLAVDLSPERTILDPRQLIFNLYVTHVIYRISGSSDFVIQLKPCKKLPDMNYAFYCIRSSNRYDLYFDATKFQHRQVDLRPFDTPEQTCNMMQDKLLRNGFEYDTEYTELPRMFTNEAFRLQLYQHQQEILKWMYDIESGVENNRVHDLVDGYFNVRLPFYSDKLANPSTGAFDDFPKKKAFLCNGGILTDGVGSGKGVTVLALHSTRPCYSFEDLKMSDYDRKVRIPSRATLIVCPMYLLPQWKSEIAKCLRGTMYIVEIINVKQLIKLTWLNIMNADFVLVSLDFLIGNALMLWMVDNWNVRGLPHHKPNDHFAFITEPMIQQGYSSFQEQFGRVNLESIFFHRIIFDEIDNVPPPYKDSPSNMIYNLKGNYVWGLAESVPMQTVEEVAILANLLSCVDYDPESRLHALRFKRVFTKKCFSCVYLPRLIQEVVHVDLDDLEQTEYENCTHLPSDEQLLKLNCFTAKSDLVDTDFPRNTQPTAKQVRERALSEAKQNKEEYDDNVVHMQSRIDELKSLLQDGGMDESALTELRNELSTVEKMIVTARQEVAEKERRIRYLKSKVDSIASKSFQDNCCICMEMMDRESEELVLSPCHHVFHQGCFCRFPKTNIVCPLCKFEFNPKRARRFTPGELDGRDKIDETDGWNVKIQAVLRTLKNITNTSPSCSAKIIMYVQFEEIAQFLEKALLYAHVRATRVSNTTVSSCDYIENYKNGDAQVIIISWDTFVSGLSLACATHVFIIHPFWFENQDFDYTRGEEARGVQFAYRIGLRKDLKVIRFVTRNTIEESIMNNR